MLVDLHRPKKTARPSSQQILHGLKRNESKFYLQNYFLLITKQHAFVSSFSDNLPSLSTFKVALMNTLQIEKQIAVRNNKLVGFRRKWCLIVFVLIILFSLVLPVIGCCLYLPVIRCSTVCLHKVSINKQQLGIRKNPNRESLYTSLLSTHPFEFANCVPHSFGQHEA